MNRIPRPIISLLAEKLPEFETHATLDNLFLYADVPVDIPNVSKRAKVQAILEQTNKKSENPLGVLGKLLEKYIELPDSGVNGYKEPVQENYKFRESILNLLEKNGLIYINGGIISNSENSLSSKSLKELISEKNIPAINLEFERALNNINSNPLDSISASSNILESICKVFIEENNLNMPNKQDLRSLWKIVSQELKFDASSLQDDDLKKIISGMHSVVDGISSLRTHGSSAHGQGKKLYMPKPRHAKFTVNSAHSLAVFLLETWNERKI